MQTIVTSNSPRMMEFVKELHLPNPQQISFPTKKEASGNIIVGSATLLVMAHAYRVYVTDWGDVNPYADYSRPLKELGVKLIPYAVFQLGESENILPFEEQEG
jgi:hypothetical protein